MGIGCVAEDGVDNNPGCESASCDDLVGRTLIVNPRVPAIPVRVQSIHTVRPVIREEGTTVTVSTDDLRVRLDEVVSRGQALSIIADVYADIRSSRYGFRFEFRSPGENEWVALVPIAGDDAWNWYQIHLRQTDDRTIEFYGDAAKFVDVLDGIWVPDQNFQSFHNSVLSVGDMEFRILAFPLWNFWDWDEYGYETEIHFSWD